MTKTVSFETAKRLKEAGFQQPEFDGGEYPAGHGIVWGEGRTVLQVFDSQGRRFYPVDADGNHSFTNRTKGEDRFTKGRLIYAPTAADICGLDVEEEAEKWIKNKENA